MADDSCQECKDRQQASQYAYRYWISYRGQHTGYRPESRWYKADRQEKDRAENAYHLAEAKRLLHVATHEGHSLTDREIMRNHSIVIRDGRLKP